MPADLVGKGTTLTGGQVLQTTTHAFRKSPRLLVQEDVTEEDDTIKLTLNDIEDIRNNTERGQQLLELITRRPGTRSTSSAKRHTDTSGASSSRRTQTVAVRLTRSQVRAARGRANGARGARRRKIARALAQLA